MKRSKPHAGCVHTPPHKKIPRGIPGDFYRNVWRLALLIGAIWFGLGNAASGALPERSWMWNVLVVPPPEGWEGNAGRSIRSILAWHEAEIADSGTGAGGHDIEFIHLPPLDEASAPSATLPINAKTVAVLSFASSEVDRILAGRLAGSSVPLLMAGGEEVLIDRPGGGPLPNLFALDLYRDYRCAAFALYAARKLQPEAHVALAASRFTVNQEREAKICYGLLDDAGFMPMPFWMDASASDAFGMVSEEIQSAADGVLIAFIGNMGAREMWRAFMRVRTPWRIWNCAAPDDSYLSCRGMIFADQNLFLSDRGGFGELRRRLWNTRAMRLPDLVAGGRAEALAEWLRRAIAALPQPVDVLDRGALLRALAGVRDIPFGAQTLDIAPGLHRPATREVCIAEVRDRRYVMLEALTAPGLPYSPSY